MKNKNKGNKTVNTIRCCLNCIHYNYEAPRLDQPYPEFWCGKERWCGIDGPEEYEALNEYNSCSDFETREGKE
jgi:hypothetical protein